ncbi:MAG: stage II sporulation protein R [Bariatricus sp.]
MERKIYLPEEYKAKHAGWKHWIRMGSRLVLALLLGLLLTGSVMRISQTSAKMQEMQKNLAEEVFRFHVLANSDSEEDQELKLKVKEVIIGYMKNELPNAQNAKETKEWATEHLDDIEEMARQTVRNEGFAYPVKASVGWYNFPDKTYGDVTFPAGEYEALRVEIGEAKGQNWWCALYPNLCFVDCVHAVVPEEGKKELESVLTEEEYEMITVGTKFKIKWYFLGDK